MTLSLYIARRFLVMLALVFGGFALLMYLVDMVEQIRRLSATEAGLGEAALLSLLNVPESVYRILPLIVILAAIALFLTLARSSELVVIRASGRSALRMLTAPFLTALGFGAVAVAVLNPVVAGTQKRYETLAESYRRGDADVFSISGEGLWLRQGGPEGQMVIRADRANPDATELFGVTFLAFDRDGAPVRRVDAAEARLEPGLWRARDAKEWLFLPGSNPERDAVRHDTLSLPSDLTADQIRDSFGAPSAVPIWQLPGFIASLERAGFSARRHLVWFQMELAQPLLLAAMVLVGAGFTMRHARFGRTGLMVLLAMGFGFAIFFLRNFAQVLGENGQIPVVLAAWAPPVAALLLSVALLLHLEDG